jgi:hypothetical protein
VQVTCKNGDAAFEGVSHVAVVPVDPFAERL